MKHGGRPRLRWWWAATGVTAVVGCATIATWIALPPPPLLAPVDRPGITLVDRHGLPVRSTRSEDGARHHWIPIEWVDPDLLLSFTAVEDTRFFSHGGVDWRAVARAARDNVRTGRVVSGASTITMQAVRLALGIDRGWWGKVRQALWAIRLERHVTKQQILEYYVNTVPLGQATIGVAAAARLYFGVSATDLSLGQAALLAGLARSPSHFDPYVYTERARARREHVLTRLQATGGATPSAIDAARREPLVMPPTPSLFRAPHYTTQLLHRLGPAHPPHGAVALSLDLDLQTALEAEVRHTTELLRQRGVRHGAVVVMDNATGDVLAWVGSPDFWADSSGQVDMVVSRRQPGSALKPFLYGLAFDAGYGAATVLPDIARTYATSTGVYQPRNYDRRFHGPVRIREALASSYNVPAVELTDRLGVVSLLETLHRAGFASLDQTAEHYGLGLSLGNGDVTLLELANAYRALANGGRWRPHRAYLAADDPDPSDEGERVMSTEAAVMVLDILSDPVARIPGFGVGTPFDFGFPVAVKTGTSRRFTDNWAIGTTAGFTVAVWVGDFSGRPMEQVSGVTGAGPLLHRAIQQTASRFPPGLLPLPAEHGASVTRVCRLSGSRPTPYCPTAAEWFYDGREPHETCTWHTPTGTALPPQYAEWLDHEGHAAEPTIAATVTRDPTPEESPVFRIISPQDGDVYQVPPHTAPQYATLALRSTGPPDGVRWWIDGVPIQGIRWRLAPGEHTARAERADGVSDRVIFRVEASTDLPPPR